MESSKIVLKNNSVIGIIGGGPAGSFFAHFARKYAKEKGLKIKILLFEGRDFSIPGPKGCNMCAGVISHSLIRHLKNEKLNVDNDKIERNIGGYYYQSGPYGAYLKTPSDENIYTVFRGNGPKNSKIDGNISFDDFLLSKIRKQGTAVIFEPVQDMKREGDRILITTGKESYRVDLICGAFGLNSNLAKKMTSLIQDYVPPVSIKAFIAEIQIGEEGIKRYYGNSIYVYNSPTKRISYATIIPKRNFITVNLIGKKDLNREDFAEFIETSGIKSRLPDDFKMADNYCHCSPRVLVSHAKNAYHDRVVIIGDSAFSRYYKNGIESAFLTAKKAAETVINNGVDKKSLRRGYFHFVKKHILNDNIYGRFFYRLNNMISSINFFNRANMQIINSVKFNRTSEKLREILWIMFTGKYPYREVARRSLSITLTLMFFFYTIYSIYRLILIGLVKTFPMKKRQRKYFLKETQIGPLQNNSVVAVVGGGPSGCAFAIYLKKLAAIQGIYLDVHLFEYKDFLSGDYYNQCSGILSPPIVDLLEKELDIAFPYDIVSRKIKGYKIYTDRNTLCIDESGEHSYAVRRVLFDKYLLSKAIESKVRVHKFRVTDIDINPDFVMVYSEGMNIKVDLVVGAFGLDDGGCKLFERATKYRQPRFLESMIIKFGLGKKNGNRFENYIHAYLPRTRDIEFSGISPKKDHVVVNIAGKNVTNELMDEFLNSDEFKKIVPGDLYGPGENLNYYKGRFPIGPAKNFYGYRYVILGDAAGMVRAFKGKGINSGIITGIAAAKTVIKNGISKGAFQEYYYSLREIINDFKYGKFIRFFTLWSKRFGLLGSLMELAKIDNTFKEAFKASVSGTKYYKEIILSVINLETMNNLLRYYLDRFNIFNNIREKYRHARPHVKRAAIKTRPAAEKSFLIHDMDLKN